jgi:hypothetical protein
MVFYVPLGSQLETPIRRLIVRLSFMMNSPLLCVLRQPRRLMSSAYKQVRTRILLHRECASQGQNAAEKPTERN